MVCSGSNQAYTNLAISLLDDGDAAVLFAPYYFNHKMALQMTGCAVVVGQTDNDLLPDLGWLRARLAETPQVLYTKIVAMLGVEVFRTRPATQNFQSSDQDKTMHP